ncbi:hypothetical protein EVAR_91460_1 [Eumeta japonica]|uniref:Uncharacterized protein n=1 Tax=Eumeta variegata TaxID=151549 RepID=A0A4C1WZ99_EUMVA|nr:hypothetical protein EVAR_91460_1 [Eumeta japonica]
MHYNNYTVLSSVHMYECASVQRQRDNGDDDFEVDASPRSRSLLCCFEFWMKIISACIDLAKGDRDAILGVVRFAGGSINAVPFVAGGARPGPPFEVQSLFPIYVYQSRAISLNGLPGNEICMGTRSARARARAAVAPTQGAAARAARRPRPPPGIRAGPIAMDGLLIKNIIGQSLRTAARAITL